MGDPPRGRGKKNGQWGWGEEQTIWARRGGTAGTVGGEQKEEPAYIVTLSVL